jgi:HD-like signal output (HDOD) protein
MPIDPQLRSLDIDIPSQPDALVRLSLLMAEDEPNLAALAALMEADMALASAVLRAVNSPLYGLSGRARSVQHAITFLGMREVAGITFEMGLRAVFPRAAELEPMWTRAAARGLIMGRLGQALGIDSWAAHSAGLFEECGKAVLFRHAPDRYRQMLHAARNDSALCELETSSFGVGHDALGAGLCESWGLNAAAVVSVRHHVAAQADHVLPQASSRRSILALSALSHVMLTTPSTLDEVVGRIAPQAELDLSHVLRAARKIQQHLETAATHGR